LFYHYRLRKFIWKMEQPKINIFCGKKMLNCLNLFRKEQPWQQPWRKLQQD